MLNDLSARIGIERILDCGEVDEVLATIKQYPSIRDEEWFLDRCRRLERVKRADELFLLYAREMPLSEFLVQVSSPPSLDVLQGYVCCTDSGVPILVWILRHWAQIDVLRRGAIRSLDSKSGSQLAESGIHEAVNRAWLLEGERGVREAFARVNRRIPEITGPDWPILEPPIAQKQR